MTPFSGKIVILGCGSVARCLLHIIFKFIDIQPSSVLVLDVQDRKASISDPCQKGVKFAKIQVNRENYRTILSKYLSEGDFLLDLCVEIDTVNLIEWCQENGVKYLNTATEVWATARVPIHAESRQQTLYMRYLRMWKQATKWNFDGPTAIVEHGANPGLVTHFVKKALMDLGQAHLKEEIPAQRRVALQEALRVKDFARIAMLLGLKTIHIAEKDTQVSSIPKKENEFVNTWSCDGLVEEAIAPAELGWGTHEKRLPTLGRTHPTGSQHQIYIEKPGFKTMVKSWVPSGEIEGMVIRHGEASSLAATLSVFNGDHAIYRPTVHYAYQACPDATASLKELEARRWKMQDKQRILTDEIVSGEDELGCLLVGEHFNPVWIGTILTIEQARALVPNQNATTVQVAISVVAAMCYAIENPNKGFCLPENIDYEYILEKVTPYLGTFETFPIDYSGLAEISDCQFTDFQLETLHQR